MGFDARAVVGASESLTEALSRVERAVERRSPRALEAAESLWRALLEVHEDWSPDVARGVVGELLALGRRARALEHGETASRLLLACTLLAVAGDPSALAFDLDPTSARARLMAHPARAAALEAMTVETAYLTELAAEAEPPHDRDADEDAAEEEEDDDMGGACALRSRSELAETARRLCALLPRESVPEPLRSRLDGGERAWSRACALLWTDSVDVEGAEAALSDESAPPLVRAAAALRVAAEGAGAGRARERAAVDVLVGLVEPSHDSWSDPWAPEGLFHDQRDPLAIALISPASRRHFAERRPERALRITRALTAALDVFPDARGQRAALAARLAVFACGMRAPPWPLSRDVHVVFPPVEDLAPIEREVLAAVARKVSVLEWQNFDVFHALGEVGFPNTHHGLRRYLGIDPPGVMDKPITLSVDGESRALPVGIAVRRMLFTSTVAVATLARAIADALTPAEIALLVCDGVAEHDGLFAVVGRDDRARAAKLLDLRMQAIEARGAEAMVAALIERADRMLDGEVPHSSTTFLLVLLTRVLGERGDVVPDRFDLMIARTIDGFGSSPTQAREILSRLPQARRDAIILHVARQQPFGDRHDFSDLLSEAARADPVPHRQKRMPKLAAEIAKLGEAFMSAVSAVAPKPDPADPDPDSDRDPDVAS